MVDVPVMANTVQMSTISAYQAKVPRGGISLGPKNRCKNVVFLAVVFVAVVFVAVAVVVVVVALGPAWLESHRIWMFRGREILLHTVGCRARVFLLLEVTYCCAWNSVVCRIGIPNALVADVLPPPQHRRVAIPIVIRVAENIFFKNSRKSEQWKEDWSWLAQWVCKPAKMILYLLATV